MSENNSYEEGNTIIITDEEGNEEKYEILFSFDSEAFNKSYVLYYLAGTQEDEEVEVMAASYTQDEKGNQGQLQAVETEEEWDMIENALEEYVEEEE